MTENLPPFSGEHPQCPKCGNRGAYTEWRPARGETVDLGVGGSDRLVAHGDYEHLRRRCERCDYEWREAIIEAAPPGDTMTK